MKEKHRSTRLKFAIVIFVSMTLLSFPDRLTWAQETDDGSSQVKNDAILLPRPTVSAANVFSLTLTSITIPDSTLPPLADIVNDEGGAVDITGEVSYSNAFFTVGVSSPMIILEDQAGFIDRDVGFIFPIESQTLGQITSDFYQSPFTYEIALPIEPQASLRDVDHDDEVDTGVMVFAIAYWTNTFGDPFLEERDLFGGGWSTAYASSRVSTDVSNKREIIGGTLLVYAPDDQQSFPAGFGLDGLLFSRDDPFVRLPQGYTLVHLDTAPFTFDRSRHPKINLIEPEEAATEDFSALSYSQAFDAMISKLRTEYAFTDYKGIDWHSLAVQFRPRFVLAERNHDKDAYLRALRDFSYMIPDGHISGPFLANEFRRETEGGLGMVIRELDDGRVIITFITPDGPADKAGIQTGAELLSFDNQPIDQALRDVVAWSAPFSTAHLERLQQLRYLVRAPIGTRKPVTIRNPGEDASTTVTLAFEDEIESFRFSSFERGLTGFELPLEFRLLESGFAYVKIFDFSNNEQLTIQLWERLMRTLNEQNVPGLVIDMRQNGGGSGFLADQMAAYFYNEEHELGNVGYYDDILDAFYFDERSVDRYYLPSEDLRYEGKIAVLIGPNCNSACEFFAFDLTIDDRAEIVGHYPTAGLGGSIDIFIMPENEYFQFTAGRAVDMNGEVHIEGKGVAPTIRVPVIEETLLSDRDFVLEAALAHLKGIPVAVTVNGGMIRIGQPIAGRFKPGVRTRYTVEVSADDLIDITITDETGDLDTILRVYSRDGELLFENDDVVGGDTVNSSIERVLAPEDTLLLVEIATIEDALTGTYLLQVTNSKEILVDVASIDGESGIEQDTKSSFEEIIKDEVDASEETEGDLRSNVDDSTELEPSTDNVLVERVPSGDVPLTDVPEDIVPTDDGSKPIDSGAQTSEESPQADEALSTSTHSRNDLSNPPRVEPEEPPPPVLGQAIIKMQGARLRVRKEPNTGAEVVGFVGKDRAYDILEINEFRTWVRIAVPNLDNGESGWVSALFVTIEENVGE